MYRIGYPFWKQAGRAGIPLVVRVDVLWDEEASVFVATSSDLRGLVCEAASLDDLAKEVNSAIDGLLSNIMRKKIPHQPVTDLRLCPA